MFGNPPFVGANQQSDKQRAQVHRIADLGKKKGTLDFVTCWFLKAGAYVQNSNASIGFVATNSITQGEQVAELWPLLFNRYHLEISFAHRTFAWGSEARGKANVHVVIIGLANRDAISATKRLFDYEDIKSNPTETQVKVISPYLFDGANLVEPHTVVIETTSKISDRPPISRGIQSTDDGQYIFDRAKKLEFVRLEPLSADYFQPFIGSEEFINGKERWRLHLDDVSPSILRSMPKVAELIANVRTFRLALQLHFPFEIFEMCASRFGLVSSAPE